MTLRTMFGLTAIVAVGYAVAQIDASSVMFWVSAIAIIWCAGFASGWTASECSEQGQRRLEVLVGVNVLNWSLWTFNHFALKFMSDARHQRTFPVAADWLLRAEKYHLFEVLAIMNTAVICLLVWKSSPSKMWAWAVTCVFLWLIIMSWGFLVASISLFDVT